MGFILFLFLMTVPHAAFGGAEPPMKSALCSSTLKVIPRPNSTELDALRIWEVEFLQEGSLRFKEMWRTLSFHLRVEWQSFEAGLASKEIPLFRAELKKFKTERGIFFIFSRIRESQLKNKRVTPALFQEWVQSIRTKEPVFYHYVEADFDQLPRKKVELSGLKELALVVAHRPPLPRPLSTFIATEGDFIIPESEIIPETLDFYTKKLATRSRLVPWGSPISHRLNRAEQFYVDNIRNLEYRVLMVQKKEGQIFDEVPELLAGDRLDPAQALLFSATSHKEMTVQEYKNLSLTWMYSDRDPYPIHGFSFPRQIDESQNKIQGDLKVVDAVLRLVRNFKLPEGVHFDELKEIEFLPLQWERTRYTENQLKKKFFTKKINEPIVLKYELGRAYAREPKSFRILLAKVLEFVCDEIAPLEKISPSYNVFFEVHAGSRRNAEYYESFGFKPKTSIKQSEDNWVLEASMIDLAEAVGQELKKVLPLRPKKE